MELKRAYAYARVSTIGQAKKETPLEGQLSAIYDYAEKNRYRIVKEYIDEGVSGRTDKRPAFQDMISDIKKDPSIVDAIIFWSMSRFARDYVGAAVHKRMIRSLGVEVISISEQFDPNDHTNKMVEGIIDVINAWYSDVVAHEVRRGLRESASSGFYPHAAPIGFVIKKIKYGDSLKNKLGLDETFAPIVRRIFDMYDQGMGTKAIASTLNNEGIKTNKGRNWSAARIGYILSNEIYTGDLVWNKTRVSDEKIVKSDSNDVIRVKGTHPAIVDREQFERVQKRLKENNPKQMHPRYASSDYLLTGIMFCGKCGKAMTGHPAKSSKYFYYNCNTRIREGTSECTTKSIRKEKLESFVLDKVKKEILCERNMKTLVDLVNQEIIQSASQNDELIEAVRSQLAEVDNKLTKLYEAIEATSLEISDIAPRIKEHISQKEKLEDTLLNLNGTRNGDAALLDKKTVISYAENLNILLDTSCTNSEKKSLLRKFIKRISVDMPKIKIEFQLPTVQDDIDAGVLPFITSSPPKKDQVRGYILRPGFTC